jgi:hypothetical protein
MTSPNIETHPTLKHKQFSPLVQGGYVLLWVYGPSTEKVTHNIPHGTEFWFKDLELPKDSSLEDTVQLCTVVNSYWARSLNKPYPADHSKIAGWLTAKNVYRLVPVPSGVVEACIRNNRLHEKVVQLCTTALPYI